MNFFIQAGEPRSTHQYDADDETLGEAIETVFPSLTESAVLVWNYIHVPIGYKYDFGIMCDDILEMLWNLLKLNEGYMSIVWPSNTFATTWSLNWQEDQLEIVSSWDTVVGGTEKLLNQQSKIDLPKSTFASEWKKPLENIFQALMESGYSKDNLTQMTMLEDIISLIKFTGVLYK
ncbi:MAG: hypothetical protein AAFU54_28910 [Chloroflexota bacterium]